MKQQSPSGENAFQRAVGLITRNFGLKLLSLALAIVLYVVLQPESTRTIIYTPATATTAAGPTTEPATPPPAATPPAATIPPKAATPAPAATNVTSTASAPRKRNVKH